MSTPQVDTGAKSAAATVAGNSGKRAAGSVSVLSRADPRHGVTRTRGSVL